MMKMKFEVSKNNFHRYKNDFEHKIYLVKMFYKDTEDKKLHK